LLAFDPDQLGYGYCFSEIIGPLPIRFGEHFTSAPFVAPIFGDLTKCS